MFELPLLGKLIGAAEGWDQMDTFVPVFYEFTRNDLGMRFIPDFVDGSDLEINLESGFVGTYDDVGDKLPATPDWSVFNN